MISFSVVAWNTIKGRVIPHTKLKTNKGTFQIMHDSFFNAL